MACCSKQTKKKIINLTVKVFGMDVISSNMQQQRALVEQLRRERNMERRPVSESCEKMMKYITDHEQEDYLLTGFSSQKVNPFREKSSCNIL